MATLSVVQWVLLGIAAFIIFVSYQAIPGALERLKPEKTSDVAHSGVFTLFVRVCGIDHLVMYFAMLGLMVFGNSTAGWIIVASAWAVATVSAVSAIIIRRAFNE